MTQKSADVSTLAGNLIGSEVLKIAGEINALKAAGKKIANFTVGDFDPRYFPIPSSFATLLQQAIAAGETNYPPSSGLSPLREAVAEFYARELKLPTQSSQVLIAGGARPLIYTTYMCLLNPGDTVLYPVPSWNNNHYAHLAQAKGIKIEALAEHKFMPTAAEITPYLKEARLLCLNSPLNPTGTVFSREDLLEISEKVLAENERRKREGRPALYLMYDQIYWKILHGGSAHHNPVTLLPEIKPYVIFIDGISKYFCGTGLRVGWAVLPEALMNSFSSFLGHLGAWAPRPEQVATAAFLRDPAAVETFSRKLRNDLASRLNPLFEGILALKNKGYAVDAIRPEGGIYLSLRIPPHPGAESNEKIREALLRDAAIAVVPFQAFGLASDSGWFRMSVGAVAADEIPYALQKLETFLKKKL